MNANLKGLRYINLVRVSDDTFGTSSNEAQLKMLNDGCLSYGMIHVDDLILNGVTGSLPGKREDLEALLRRKREKNDFDVIVLQRADRLTRGGPAHAFWFEHECRRVGLILLFIGDDIPDGRYSSLIKVAKYETAQEQAFSISQRSTQGSQFALDAGRVMPPTHTNYGCWRLYLNADGTPLHLIRDMGDDRQQKLDPKTYQVIDTYGSIGGGASGHYRKQKTELVLLYPGDVAEAQVVREIFHLHYILGWGGKRISDLLNSRGVPSPNGKEWSQRQVESIYEQEAYTGRSIANRTSSAIYHERSQNAPKPVNLDPAVHATAKSIPKRDRPFEEWKIVKQPFMTDFLPPDVRKLAMAAHKERWRRESDPDRARKSKSKHKGSEYLLTGLLFALQDGEPLTGVLCGPAGHTVRYYRHRRGRRGYRKGSVFNRMFPAEPLERGVLAMLREVLTGLPDLRQRIEQCVDAQIKAASNAKPLLDDLYYRREQVSKRLNLILANFDQDTLVEAKEQIARFRSEAQALDAQIAAMKASQQMSAIDPKAVVEKALSGLVRLAESLESLPPIVLRQVLSNLVDKVVCDMETKEVRVEFRLPGWFISGQESGSGELRLATSRESSASYETQRGTGVLLGSFQCDYDKSQRTVCFKCYRLPKAG